MLTVLVSVGSQAEAKQRIEYELTRVITTL